VGLFSQILEGDSEASIYGDPYARGTPRLNIKAPEELKRKVLQDVGPDLEGRSLTGLAGNAMADIGHFAGGLGAILGQVLVHPVKSAEAVGNAALHPIDTAKMLAEPFIENYTPRPDESVTDMLERRAYDHPFDTLVDASFIVGGPSGVAAKVAAATGFERTASLFTEVASRASHLDPITQAQKVGGFALKTMVPDAWARMRTASALADKTAEETTRQDWLMKDFNGRLAQASAHLNSAEMAIRFPYAEGRIPIVKDDIITEITHRGTLESRKVEAGTKIRTEALDQFRDQYNPLRQEYERMAKIDPESYASGKAEAHRRTWDDRMAKDPTIDPMDADNAVGQVYTESFQEATERQTKRAAKSTFTALDVAKETDFRERAAKLSVEQTTFDLEEIMGMLPQQARTTMNEAMELMGPKGGIIVPHSGEVLTRDQATFGNVLTKVGEANVYKENTGAKFASGQLEHLDPSAALSRVYRAAVRGDSTPRIFLDAAEKAVKDGTAVEMTGKDWRPNLDPDLIAGTHQPFHPGTMHLDGAVQEHFDRLMGRLNEVAPFDEAARNVNMGDVAEGMAKHAESTFPLSEAMKNRVFKIKSSMGDELAFYKKSFEPSTNPLAQISDKWVMQPYNLMNLGAKGTRILNNGYGNTEFIAMQGMLPFTARGLDSLLTWGRAVGGRFGLLADETSQKLGGMFDLPGVGAGGLSHTEAFQTARGLGDRIAAGEVAPRLGRLANNPLLRTFGKWTQMVTKANENLEDIYRVGSAIYEMKPGGMESIKNLIHGSASMAAFGDRVEELTKMGVNAMDDAGLKSATKGMNRWLNDYKRTTAFERVVGRHVFPYHKFYKHSAEVLLRFPFEAPIKGQLARGIGNAALNDVKETLKSYGFDWDTMVPDFMRDSVPIKMMPGADGGNTVLMLNTKGPNPFSFLAGKDAGEQGIGALHPLAKIAIEQATGINMFTREKFQGPMSTFSGRKVDMQTGEIVEDYNRPGLVDHYLRQFWPYQTIRDIAAHGRVANDTAGLLDLMGSGSPGTYQLDNRGLQRRKPQPLGALTPLARMVGPIPQTLQAPTREQRAGRKAITSSQFADMLQQHPEARARILASLRQAARSYRGSDESKDRTLPPRRF